MVMERLTLYSFWRNASFLLKLLIFVNIMLVSYVSCIDPAETYRRLVPCILDFKNVTKPAGFYKYPADAEEHYKMLLEKTAKYRKHRPHKHTNGYHGPWIENLWIEEFISKPLSFFQGLIPLFVQWVDIHAHIFLGKENRPLYKKMYEEIPAELSALLRPDVLYVTVSQDDEGIDTLDHRGLFNLRPNILTLSAGGYGHIPIPLVMGEHNYVKPGRFDWTIGFYGQHDTSLTRAGLLEEAKTEIKVANLRYNQAVSPQWHRLMCNTLFNLCPRGYGRSSFRLAEVIQTGRVPVYLYNDVPWLPYGTSNISISHIGYSAKPGQLMQSVMANISGLTIAEQNTLLQRVHEARYHYTLPGVIAQIHKFLQDPLGPDGGELRCAPVPPTVI